MTYKKLLLLSFVFNGVLMIGMKAVDGMNVGHALSMVLFLQYALGAVFSAAGIRRSKKPISRKDVAVGVTAGVSSLIGMAATMTVAQMIPGYIVFPIIQGGTLLAGVLFGVLAFRERVGPCGIAGIACGIAAIVVLSR